MTNGRTARDVRELAEEQRKLEDRITIIETGEGWKGDERRNGATFSDKQTAKINELIETRAAFFRLILWALGAFASLAVTLILAYLKLK